mmetsp:Transcript_7053/g.17923  ORF Transcript_7053/g.17923 Transcript_7053/m.17923 type:complete len:104 (-) Transcript_7053:107-418(-)
MYRSRPLRGSYASLSSMFTRTTQDPAARRSARIPSTGASCADARVVASSSSSSSSSSTDSGDDGIIEGTVVAASTLRVGGQSEQLCVFASTSKREGQQEKKVF